LKRGFLISFEGGDGCGKSTQIKRFCKKLEEKGIEYILSVEPGGTKLAKMANDILKSNKQDLSVVVELLLFSAARADHVDKIIRPALEQGKVVVLDRYYDSTYAYQGGGGKMPFELISQVTELAVCECKPDLTFVLDISYEEAFNRKSKDEKLKHLDRFESKGKAYHDNVRQAYLDIAEIFKDRIVVVDADRDAQTIEKEIWAEFEKRKLNK